MKKFKKGDKAVMIIEASGNYGRGKGVKFEIVEVTFVRTGVISVATEGGFDKFRFDTSHRSSYGNYIESVGSKGITSGVGLYPYSVEDYKLNGVRNKIADQIRKELDKIEMHTVSELNRVLRILVTGYED